MFDHLYQEYNELFKHIFSTKLSVTEELLTTTVLLRRQDAIDILSLLNEMYPAFKDEPLINSDMDKVIKYFSNYLLVIT